MMNNNCRLEKLFSNLVMSLVMVEQSLSSGLGRSQRITEEICEEEKHIVP